MSPPQHFEKRIWVVFNQYEKFGARSKFYRAWTLVKKRPPRKNERMTPKDLVGHIVLIRTRTVTKDEHGNERPDFDQYSTAEIIGYVQPAQNHFPKTFNQKLVTGNQKPETKNQLPSFPRKEVRESNVGMGSEQTEQPTKAPASDFLSWSGGDPPK